MSNLLFANIMRLVKNKCFWGCACVMFSISVYLPIMFYMKMRAGNTILLEDGFFSCSIFLAILLSVFCSLFIGTDYSDSTIRNKLIIGHKRIHIYLANLLTNIFTGIILYAIYYITYLCIGIPLLGLFHTDLRVILLFTVIVVMLCTAFSSLFTMIAMLNPSKAIAAIICIISTFLLITAGTYTYSQLQQPETIPYYNYDFATGDAKLEKNIENPNSLKGTKRKVYQFLHDFLPGGQIIQCTSMEAENPPILPIYSGIIFIITTTTGAIIFRRKDIK